MELDSVRSLKAEIDERRERLETLRKAAIYIPQLDGLPRAKGTESPTEKIAVAIAELETELVAMLDDFNTKAAELLKAIVKRVGGIGGRILALRYVCCLPFKEIIAEIGLSTARVYQIHSEAVKKFNSER